MAVEWAESNLLRKFFSSFLLKGDDAVDHVTLGDLVTFDDLGCSGTSFRGGGDGEGAATEGGGGRRRVRRRKVITDDVTPARVRSREVTSRASSSIRGGTKVVIKSQPDLVG